MKNHNKIILELTSKEIKLLAYGAIPKDLKERFREIAYYLDEQENLDKSKLRDVIKKMKRYNN